MRNEFHLTLEETNLLFEAVSLNEKMNNGYD